MRRSSVRSGSTSSSWLQATDASRVCWRGGVTVRADAYPVGHSRRTIHPDLVQSLRPKLLQRGLLGERELDELDTGVRAHLGDPRTLVIPHLYVLAWGRKP
jgi:hypothetical protein